MGYLVKGEDAVTPSSFVHNLATNAAANHNGKGPYLMALSLWCDVPDAGLGGGDAWELTVEYDDPTGATVVLGQGAFGSTLVPLNSATPYKVVPLSPLDRLSATSNWRIVGNLIGSAGASKISWRVWLLPQFSYELGGF